MALLNKLNKNVLILYAELVKEKIPAVFKHTTRHNIGLTGFVYNITGFKTSR